MVTISGNTVNTQQNAQTGSAAEPTNNLQPTETPTPTHENLGAAIPTDAHVHPDLQTTADARLAEASADVTRIDPKAAAHLDQLFDNRIGVATDATEGLASIGSNLEGIFKITDLVADVSASPRHIRVGLKLM